VNAFRSGARPRTDAYLRITRAEALKQLTARGEPYELFETQALGRTIRAFVNAPATLRELYEQGRSPTAVHRLRRGTADLRGRLAAVGPIGSRQPW
jgi:hypothetical protein